MDGYLTKEKNKLTIPFVKINNKWFYKTGDIFRKITFKDVAGIEKPD